MNPATLVKLRTQTEDSQHYITYVFEILEESEQCVFNTKYLFCTRFPNWEHRDLETGEIGYLEFKENLAGQTTWYDGEKMCFHKYDSIQFMKFITKPEQKENNLSIIL